MKRILSLIIALCLIFGSFSFAFAAATDVSDAQTHTLLNGISSLISGSNGVNAYLQRIANYLFIGSGMSTGTLGYYVRESASYLYDIRDYASQIASGVSGSGGTGIGTLLENIFNELIYTSTGGAITHLVLGTYQNLSNIYTRLGSVNTNTSLIQTNTSNLVTHALNILNSLTANLPDIKESAADIYTVNSNTLPGIYAYAGNIYTLEDTYLPNLQKLVQSNNQYQDGFSAWNTNTNRKNGHTQLVSGTTGIYNSLNILSNGNYSTLENNWLEGSPLGNIALLLRRVNDNIVSTYVNRWTADLTGYNVAQTFTNWTGSTLTTSTFTPTSATNGIYNWLSKIQTPIARLAFVHASDEEIRARQLAEDNQDAVIDNFIDSSGSGSVSASDFGSMASASGSFEDQFSTGQSASGIWNTFSNDNFIYLSRSAQEQMDSGFTTSKNIIKTSPSLDYPTPGLDSYYEELNKILGVNSID